MNHHLFRGIGVSLLLHGLVLCSIVYLGILLPDLTPPLVIDFSIENDSANRQPSNSPHNLPRPTQEKAKPSPSKKKALPVNKPQVAEKKSETVKPKQPEPKPVKAEAQKPVPKKIAPLQTKKRMEVEEKVIVTAVEPITESIPVQTQEKEVEPSLIDAVEKAPSILPATVPEIQTNSPSPKEQYLKANFSFIRDLVKRKTSYPNIARRMGWEGRVLVAFIVCTDGQVEDIRIIKSCGFKALDKNAIKTIKGCAPFPKPPIRAEVTLPITYRLH